MNVSRFRGDISHITTRRSLLADNLQSEAPWCTSTRNWLNVDVFYYDKQTQYFILFSAICLRQGSDQAVSMSGLQHPLEANGGRSTHGYPAGNGSMAAVPGQPPTNAVTLPHTTLLPPGNSSTYIRAGAPHIPPPPTTAVQSMGQSQTPVEFNRNPLLCILCNQAFQNPCLLACYHTFCAACLRGRAVDGKLACPLCG